MYYYEKEELKSDPKKKKGEIQLCGYTIKVCLLRKGARPGARVS